MDTIRAIYEGGQLRLLDSVDLAEGQTVNITISTEKDHVRAALGDLIASQGLDENEQEIEDYIREVEAGISGSRPFSDIIIEERGEQL